MNLQMDTKQTFGDRVLSLNQDRIYLHVHRQELFALLSVLSKLTLISTEL
jgi:hypothetical protein